jgi:hypothetical protein
LYDAGSFNLHRERLKIRSGIATFLKFVVFLYISYAMAVLADKLRCVIEFGALTLFT